MKLELAGHRRWEDSLQRIDKPDLGILPPDALRLIDPAVIRTVGVT